jgi:NADH:ubiquinone oxidoreductase subunit
MVGFPDSAQGDWRMGINFNGLNQARTVPPGGYGWIYNLNQMVNWQVRREKSGVLLTKL